MLSNFKPKDYVAMTTILTIFIYKALGHNGGFDAIVALIIGYYFGRRDDPTLQLPDTMVKEQTHNVELKKP